MIYKAMGMVEIFQRKVQIRKKAKDGTWKAKFQRIKVWQGERSSKGDGEAASEVGKRCACMNLGKKVPKKMCQTLLRSRVS